VKSGTCANLYEATAVSCSSIARIMIGISARIRDQHRLFQRWQVWYVSRKKPAQEEDQWYVRDHL